MTSLPSIDAGPRRPPAQQAFRRGQGQVSSPGSSLRANALSSPSKAPTNPLSRQSSTKGPDGRDAPRGTDRQDSNRSSKSNKSRHTPWLLREAEQARLQKRVEEMKLWKPENDFLKESEYWQRRDSKRKEMQMLVGDKRLVQWKKLYIPAFLGIAVGFSLVLICSIRGLGEGTFLWPHRWAFQVTGFSVLAGGLLLLMLVAGATYHVEDKLRKELGLPPMFIVRGRRESLVETKVKDTKQTASVDGCVTLAKNRARGLRSLAVDPGETSAFLDAGRSLSGPGQSSAWPPAPQGTGCPVPVAPASTEEGRRPRRTLRVELAGQRSMSVESENSSGYSTGLSDSGRGGDGARLPAFASAVFSRNGVHRLSEVETTPAARETGEYGLSTLASCPPCRLRDRCVGLSLWAVPHPGSAVRCSPYNLRFGPRESAHPIAQEVSQTSSDVVEVDHSVMATSSCESDVRRNDASVTSPGLPDVHGRIGIHLTPAGAFDVTGDGGFHAKSLCEGATDGSQEGGQWGRAGGKPDRATPHSFYRVGVADVVIHATREDYV